MLTLAKQLVTVGGQELSYAMVSTRHRLLNGAEKRVKVLVNGSPKTGTVWMVKLLASIPGYQAVGNFTGNLDAYHSVARGSVLHGHEWFSSELWQVLSSNKIKVVLMVRDPRDQVVSRMFHIRRSAPHSWHEKMQRMSEDEALMACIVGDENLPGAPQMLNLSYSWLNENGSCFRVRYEDLLRDPVRYYQSVLHYLGLELDETLAQKIVDRNRFERLSLGKRIWKPARKQGQEDPTSHFRKGISGDWKNYFKPEHVERFKAVAGEALVDLGYETGLDW